MTERWQETYDDYKCQSPDDEEPWEEGEDDEQDYREREADRECDER